MWAMQHCLFQPVTVQKFHLFLVLHAVGKRLEPDVSGAQVNNFLDRIPERVIFLATWLSSPSRKRSVKFLH